MITRRTFLTYSGALLASGFLLFKTAKIFSSKPRRRLASTTEDLTPFVDPMIGTGGHGHTYPGATVPYGAVQLSPDTGTGDWDHCSGYLYSDTSIMGFSHTHLSGTGCGDLMDVLVNPGVGTYAAGFRHPFQHANERAEVGYYSVALDSGIKVELTATERTGIQRYTFAQGGPAYIVVDLDHHAGTQLKDIDWAQISVQNQNTIVGGRGMLGWARGRQIYFSLNTSLPFDRFEIYANGVKQSSGSSASGKNIGYQAVLYFSSLKPGGSLLVKTGISGVSTDGAGANLRAENPGWDFDGIRAAARQSWQNELSRVQIETTDLAQKKIFYTGLYHSMLAPTLFDDVDGRYRGMDGQIHTLSSGENNYSTYSLWDTFRALHPLLTLMQGPRVPSLVNGLIRMAKEASFGMPIWPLQGRETYCMTGYHSVSVIAEACTKGFQGIDYQTAYALMYKRSFQDNFAALPSYRSLGYASTESLDESASWTLELCYNDWAIAHVAHAVGANDVAQALAKRSLNYKNLLDPQTKFIRAKNAQGKFVEPFNPLAPGHLKGHRDYTESNAWQTTFGIMHDPQGLIDGLGGRDAFLQKLDLLFSQSSVQDPSMPPDVAGLVGQYAHGNEPSHHIAYLYAYAGAPYKTQFRVRQLMRDMYRAQPDGLAGNEDCGQMSAWYVMSSMGFYAVDPASGNYVFGSPLFDRVEIEIRDGAALVLETQRRSPDDIYIQSVTFNDQPYTKTWFRHQDIKDGGHFVFTMGPQPNLNYGANAADLPPSLPSFA